MDFPRAWEIARAAPLDKHHERCSFRQTGGALLCDCEVLTKHPEYDPREGRADDQPWPPDHPATTFNTSLEAIKLEVAKAAVDTATAGLGWATRFVRWLSRASWRLWLPLVGVAFLLVLPPAAVRAGCAIAGVVPSLGQACVIGYSVVMITVCGLALTAVLYYLGKWWDDEDHTAKCQADLTNNAPGHHISHNEGKRGVPRGRKVGPGGAEGPAGD